MIDTAAIGEELAEGMAEVARVDILRLFRHQIDAIGERVRKLGEVTLTSIGSVARATQVKDQDSTDLDGDAMVKELHDDNVAMIKRLKGMKPLAEEAGDNATDGLLDDWTDMAEERAWFLKSTLG